MKIILKTILLLLALNCAGQNNISIGQYFQLMQAFAPGLTGANDFLDIRTGFRNQWIGYDGAPNTSFIGANGSFAVGKANNHKFNSVRVSNMSAYETHGVKLGVGGYIFIDKIGEFKQIETMASIALHIPIQQKIYLSLGISTGYYNTRLNLDNIFVLLPDDDNTYQGYLQNSTNNNSIKLNTGLAVYSNRFYFSYSILNIANVMMNGNSLSDEFVPQGIHSIVTGLIVDIGPHFEAIPNTYLRYTSNTPLVFDAGIRVRYKQNPYFGISIRNDKSYISMLGFTINDQFKFGYSYEFKALGGRNINANSHEITLGIQIFNHNKYVPIW